MVARLFSDINKMNFKFFKWLTIRITMLIAIVSSIATSCSAHPSTPKRCDVATANKDSVMTKAVVDSIYTIISNAKKVKAEIIKAKTDSASSHDLCYVKRKYIPLVKFVISDPRIYNLRTPAYGSFMPCFSLTFYKKKEICVAKFDFGLKKWAIYDCNGKELATFDLSSNDMLRVADLLFPDSKYLQSLINP